VPTSAIIGEKNKGWTVANTTLANERAGLGAGGGGGGLAMVTPGTIAGSLDKRVGDFARTPKASGEAKKTKQKDKKKSDQSTAAILIGYAKGNGTSTDPTIRQDLVRLHILGELGRFNGERLKAPAPPAATSPAWPTSPSCR